MVREYVSRLGLMVAGCVALASSVVAQRYDGDGVMRFGLFGAGTFFNADPRVNDLTPAGVTFPSTKLNGGSFGFTAGYDYRLWRSIVLGVEADASVGDWHGAVGDTGVDVDFMASLRGRLGGYMTRDLLLYVTGGFAWEGLKARDTFTISGTQVDTARTRTGGIFGAGIEYDLRNDFGMILFAEYLHAEFSSFDSAPRMPFSLDNSADTFRLGVKFKVGHDYVDDVRDRGYGNHR